MYETPLTTLPRRERERLLRRRAMLDAAQSVFAEKGYTQATLEEIAQRAEFGKGTLYNYFPDGKEELLFAIFDEIYDEFGTVIAHAFSADKLEDQPFRALFHDFLEQCFMFYIGRQDLFMILMKEAHRMAFSEDKEKAQYFFRQRERIVDAMIEPLAIAMERGTLTPLPVRPVAYMLLGNINGCQMQMCLDNKVPESQKAALQAARDAATFLTTMLLDGLLAEPVSAPLTTRP